MILLIILASAVCAFLLFLALQVRQYSRPVEKLPQLIPIDLEAFAALTDPEEETFLQGNLPTREFRLVQRGRIRALKPYLSAFSRNASALIVAGQSARYHADAQVAASGVEIIQRAVRLKIWCGLSLVRLNSAIVFPALSSPSSEIARPYRLLTGMALDLTDKSAI
ncbi:MAG TPA: hypothetical protein VL983_06650 [Terriglobales bacterium]|nr:hypothetical protein [Terriglobales bacterium]